jgi:hypothetical protein
MATGSQLELASFYSMPGRIERTQANISFIRLVVFSHH